MSLGWGCALAAPVPGALRMPLPGLEAGSVPREEQDGVSGRPWAWVSGIGLLHLGLETAGGSVVHGSLFPLCRASACRPVLLLAQTHICFVLLL